MATNYTLEEQGAIVNALEVIAKVCKEHGNCEACPLYSKSDRDCIFEGNTPSSIHINKPDGAWYAVV